MKATETLLIDAFQVTLALARASISGGKHLPDKNFPFYIPLWKFKNS